MANVLDAFVRFLADTKDVDAAMNQRIPGAAGAAGQKAGSAFSGALGKAFVGIGAAGGLAFASAIEGATAFEDQLHIINTVAKLGPEELKNVGQDILNLSKETGKTTDDLTSSFYDLVSAGVPAGEAIKVLKDSAVLATGALGTTNEAVDLVTSALGAYGLSADKSTRVTDIFAQAVADGKTTVAELAGGISQVAPIAAATGVSLEEVAAATAIMTLKGDTASQAMTRIKAAISALITPNKALLDLQAKTGENYADMVKAGVPLTVVLDKIRTATAGDNEQFAKILGSTEAMTLAFATTGENAGSMAGELDKVTTSADTGGVALGQYNEAQSSAAAGGRRMTAQIKAFLVEVGGPFVQTLGPALQTLNLLGPAFGRGGIAAKAFGAVLGGLVGKGILPAINGLKNLAAAGRLGGFLQDLSLGRGLQASIKDAFTGIQNNSVVKATIGRAAGALGQLLGKGMAAGQAIAKGVATGLEALSSSPVIQRASAAAGRVGGTAFGKAFGIAAAAAAVVAVVFVAKEVSDAIEKQKQGLVEQARTFARDASDAALQGAREGVQHQMEEDLKSAAFFASLPMGVGLAMAKAKTEGAEGAKRVLDAIDAELSSRAMSEGIAAKLAGETPAIAAAADDVGDAIGDGISEGAHRADTSVLSTASNILATLSQLRSDLVASAQGVANALYDPILKAGELAETQEELRATRARIRSGKLTGDELREAEKRRAELGKILITQTAEMLTYGTQAEQIAKTKAFLASGFWPEAYEDANPELRAALDDFQATLRQKLSDMEDDSGVSSGEVVDRYTLGLRDGKDDVYTAADTMTSGADTPLARAKNEAYTAGANTGANYAAGLISMKARVATAAAVLAAQVTDRVQIDSPAKEGPLSLAGGPEGMGAKLVHLWAEGMRSRIGEVADAASLAAGAVSSGLAVGAFIDPALGTSQAGSGVYRSGIAPTAQRATIGQQNINVEVEGLLKARDPFDLGDRMIRLKNDGVFDPPEEYR